MRLELAPSPLRAAIRMKPKNANWPADPIDVEVQVDDGGAAIPAAFALRLTVRINTTEVPVEWSRRGSLWRARIAPQMQPGPWVVRVEARDPFGNEIGRSFVEVSGPALDPMPIAAR
ncbi:MAG: hypothetical protein ABIY55_35025 [Kofleriaceae bacterium]